MDRPIGFRTLREVFKDLIAASEHTDEFARVFSALSQDESWSLYAGRTQNRIARILLAETLRTAEIRLNETFDFPQLSDYLDYLEPVSIHCRLTDSDDALKVASLSAAASREWREMQEAPPPTRAEEIEFALRFHSRPTVLLVPRVGLLLLEDDTLANILSVTSTSVSIRWTHLSELLRVDLPETLLLQMPLEPVRRCAETTAAVSLLEAAAEASGCEHLFQ